MWNVRIYNPAKFREDQIQIMDLAVVQNSFNIKKPIQDT